MTFLTYNNSSIVGAFITVWNGASNITFKRVIFFHYWLFCNS